MGDGDRGGDRGVDAAGDGREVEHVAPRADQFPDLVARAVRIEGVDIVTRSPRENIRARVAPEQVVAAASGNLVVAVLAPELVVAGAAGDEVVTGAAADQIGLRVADERVVRVAAGEILEACDPAEHALRRHRDQTRGDARRPGGAAKARVRERVFAAAGVDLRGRPVAVCDVDDVVPGAEQDRLDLVAEILDRRGMRSKNAGSDRRVVDDRDQPPAHGREIEGVDAGAGGELEDPIGERADEDVEIAAVPPGEQVAAGAAVDHVVAAAADDGVVTLAAVNRVLPGTAGQRIAPSLAADDGASGKAGGIDGVGGVAAGEMGPLDGTDEMIGSIPPDHDVRQGDVDVVVEQEQILPAATVVGIDRARGPGDGGEFRAERDVDHHERVVSRLAANRVTARAADERVAVVAAREHVVAVAAEEHVGARERGDRVVAVVAECDIPRRAAGDLVVVGAPFDAIGLGIAPRDRVVALVAVEVIALLAADDQVVAAAAADPVVAPLRRDPPGQCQVGRGRTVAGHVVAVEFVGVRAAAAVDPVVAVGQELVDRLVAEADIDRLRALDHHRETLPVRVLRPARRQGGQPAVRERRQGEESALEETGGRRLQLPHLPRRVERHEVLADRLQADQPGRDAG
jgi:hypothetical protein